MAKIKMIKNTKNLDNYIEGVKDIDPIIKVTAFRLMGNLLTAYSQANNLSDSKTNKQLTSEYQERKQDSGRKGIRDLNLSGKLTQSFAVTRENFSKYSIGPRGKDEQLKMEGNLGYDSNLMKIGDKSRKKVIDFVNDKIKKGNK